MSELKPCPFCGMNYAENAWDECGSEYWVCEFCGAASGTARDEYGWNTRPIEDTLNKRIAELVSSNMVMAKGVLDLKARIAELEEAQRWIPVSERLPENRATVLAAFENREILTATYYKHHEGFGGVENYWHIEGWHSGNVTHWMPLPPNPESPNDTQTQTFVYGKDVSRSVK